MSGRVRPTGAAAYLPDTGGVAALRTAARSCRGCELHRNATQTVFGAGNPAARVVLVGEQPGDHEDREGAPFVGPAGRLLDRAFRDAGIDRSVVWLTNAVKHFSFRPDERGTRRIHQRPRSGEIAACRPGLAGELRAVRPELVVCLGAIAARAVVGPAFRLTDHRGELLPHPEPAGDLAGDWCVLATVHPAAVLRAPDRDKAYAEFAGDLRAVGRFLTA